MHLHASKKLINYSMSYTYFSPLLPKELNCKAFKNTKICLHLPIKNGLNFLHLYLFWGHNLLILSGSE